MVIPDSVLIQSCLPMEGGLRDCVLNCRIKKADIFLFYKPLWGMSVLQHWLPIGAGGEFTS